ncbi:hypothetical protein [Lignipirellula cremea]|uniref:Uncharacterized protein n=1 Tax=Lignipirellula cremea TaxID=2528010 RepID=A0A518E031_9BACT|nr:hypothetical protein [Lignipirellula cremea]QDU97444.1 hypothetical protein Pla8534_52920 [Lignipirellula cremea]
MSRPTEHAGYREVIYIGPPPPRPSNWLGAIGFFTTFLSCGVLSPVGLLLSLLALPGRPRSFALAGVVLGGLGTGLIVSAYYGMSQESRYLLNQGLTRATVQRLREAREVLQYQTETTGGVPDGVQGNKAILHLTDAWENSLRYDLHPEEHFYVVRSAGVDQQYETRDDLMVRVDYLPSDDEEEVSYRR